MQTKASKQLEELRDEGEKDGGGSERVETVDKSRSVRFESTSIRSSFL